MPVKIKSNDLVRGDPETIRETAREPDFNRMALSIRKSNRRDLRRAVLFHGEREASGGVLSSRKDDDGFHFFFCSAGFAGVVLMSSTIFRVVSGFAFRYSIVASEP